MGWQVPSAEVITYGLQVPSAEIIKYGLAGSVNLSIHIQADGFK